MSTEPANVKEGKGASVQPPGAGKNGSAGGNQRSAGFIWEILERFGVLFIFIAILIYFSIQSSTFSSSQNFQNIASAQSVTAVLALALLFPLITGNFDLSTGSIAIASSILVAKLQHSSGWELLPACGFAIGVALVIGLANGLVITKLGVNSFIATLASSTILGGFIQLYSNNETISEGFSRKLGEFGINTWLGIPLLALVAIVFSVIIAYVQTQTPYGRKLTAVGSNQAAAELVGIRVNRLVLSTFLISALLSALAGIMLLAQTNSANPATNGIAVLVPALAAVYLGAAVFFPGVFNVPGMIVGLLLVACLVSGLTLTGTEPWILPVCQGGALIVAVGASAQFRKQRLRAKVS
jgi:ribose transport system permease protein